MLSPFPHLVAAIHLHHQGLQNPILIIIMAPMSSQGKVVQTALQGAGATNPFELRCWDTDTSKRFQRSQPRLRKVGFGVGFGD